MIRTSRQLKDLVRNLAQSTGIPNYILLRRYMMERFLERLSQTAYRDVLILKGGMLISEMVGIEARATKDIDATAAGIPLNEETIKRIIHEIIAVDIGDHVAFSMVGISPIMDESEYEGLRVNLETKLDGAITPLKIDISTGDAITPKPVAYDYRLMFENRTIPIKAYPIETVLAEKIETMISRSDTNTRMRDFYDVHILLKSRVKEIDEDTLKRALSATAKRRGTEGQLSNAESILHGLENSPRMVELWKNYQSKNSYAIDFTWEAMMLSARKLCLMCGLDVKKPSLSVMLSVAQQETNRIENTNKRKPKKDHNQER